MPEMTTLHDLFLMELRDILDAEKQITKALPKMARKASSEELRSGFEEHLQQTHTQIERLEQVFELMEQKARGHKCEGMKGLIEEGAELMSEDAEDDVLDAGLIASAQKVEHYEISAYGTLCTWARQLGMDEAAELLEESLEEEKETDRRLTELAEAMVNQEAARGEDDEEEETVAVGAGAGGRGRAVAGRRSAAGKTKKARGGSRSGGRR